MFENGSQGRKAVQVGTGTALLLDSITMLQVKDAESVIVVAQTDPQVVAEAAKHRTAAIFIASAADESQYAALAIGDKEGLSCAAIETAAAGSSVDAALMWASGKVVAVNAVARRRGVKEGMTAQQAAGLILAMLRVG